MGHACLCALEDKCIPVTCKGRRVTEMVQDYRASKFRLAYQVTSIYLFVNLSLVTEIQALKFLLENLGA